MRIPSVVLALSVIGLLSVPAGFAEEPADPTPGGIKLLPGYKHEKLQGIDTRVGKIAKASGFAFGYDIGKLAGDAAGSLDKDTLLWRKEQVIDGQTVRVALTKDRMLYVTFTQTHANFYGKAKSDDEVADMLLMVLTYANPVKSK
ncbi:hypothetical protein [Zavarzinella formosa]|uniref:hypothetical protein n=1 Tax=Zavarzinella formosa TaxID=360055 RepID=UPI0002EFFDEE|nr:hypothetical protein [Zavarzinella formosa]